MNNVKITGDMYFSVTFNNTYHIYQLQPNGVIEFTYYKNNQKLKRKGLHSKMFTLIEDRDSKGIQCKIYKLSKSIALLPFQWPDLDLLISRIHLIEVKEGNQSIFIENRWIVNREQ